MCLIWKGSKSYEEISNLAALFGRKKSINNDAFVLLYFVIFLSILRAGGSPGASQPAADGSASPPSARSLPPAPTVTVLLPSHRTDCGAQPGAPPNFQGRCLGPLWLWPSRLNVSPHFIPIPRSFTFQLLHQQTFVLKFITCSISHFTKINVPCSFFSTRTNKIHIFVIFNLLPVAIFAVPSVLQMPVFAYLSVFSGCVSGQYAVLAWLVLPASL